MAITNLGAACHLFGQPNLVGVDAAGRDVDVIRHDMPPTSPQTINIAPQQSASAQYHGVQRAAGVTPNCPTYKTLTLTVPGIPHRFPVYGDLCQLDVFWAPPDPYENDQWSAPEPVAATPTQAGPTCLERQVTADIERTIKQHGRVTGSVILVTNHGPACTLRGFPTLTENITTQQGETTRRTQIGVARQTPRGPTGGLPTGQDPPLVHLGTAQVASILLDGLVPPIEGASGCPRWTELSLVLPGQQRLFHLQRGDDADANYLCDLQVHPVLTGPSGGATTTISTYRPVGVIGPIPTPQPTFPPCTTAQLSINFGVPYGGLPTDPALADSMGILVFTNHGPACGMYGYPTLTAVNAAGQILVQADQILGTKQAFGAPIPAVDLTTGQSASASYNGYNDTTEAKDCRPYAAFLITPPGGGSPTKVPHTGSDCALQINPITPGNSG